jgi:hypothetical protein
MKRGIFVILVVALLGVFYVLTPNAAPTETPTAVMSQEQWTPVKGGEDLTQGKFWERVARMNFVNGKLVIAAGDSYATIVNQSGFYLEIHGNFGVSATFEALTDDYAGISLYGALPEKEWWRGTKRLDLGIKSGQVSINIWDGTGPKASVSRVFKVSGLSRMVQLAIRDVGREFIIIAHGTEVGRLDDPGLFVSGKVYLGANVSPKNQMTIHTLSVETEAGGEANIQIRMPTAIKVEIPKDVRDQTKWPVGFWTGILTGKQKNRILEINEVSEGSAKANYGIVGDKKLRPISVTLKGEQVSFITPAGSEVELKRSSEFRMDGTFGAKGSDPVPIQFWKKPTDENLDPQLKAFLGTWQGSSYWEGAPFQKPNLEFDMKITVAYIDSTAAAVLRENSEFISLDGSRFPANWFWCHATVTRKKTIEFPFWDPKGIFVCKLSSDLKYLYGEVRGLGVFQFSSNSFKLKRADN